MSEINFSKIRAEDLIFGRLLIKKNFLPKDEISHLLKNQQENNQEQALSQFLLDQGKITPSQVSEILKIQREDFMICPECYAQFNIESFQNGKKFKCKCGHILKVDRKEKVVEKSLTFEEVQEYLCIDSKELGLMIASQELQGFLDGAVMKFKLKNVDRVKRSKEIQPTMILNSGFDKEMLRQLAPISTSFAKEKKEQEEKEDLFSMEKVLSILQIKESKLRKMMTVGELIPQNKDGEICFSKKEVLRMKHAQEAQPTMIMARFSLEKEMEQLLSFEEVMEDLQTDAIALRNLMNEHEIHEISRGGNSFYRTSEIALLRSALREKGNSDTKKVTSPSPPKESPPKESPPKESPPKESFTFEEVMNQLNLSPKELRQFVVSGDLESFQEDEELLFTIESVESFRKRRKKLQPLKNFSPTFASLEKNSSSQLQKIPLLKKIPLGSLEAWKELEDFESYIQDYILFPGISSSAYGIANPDNLMFSGSDILFVEPHPISLEEDLKNIFLIKMKNSPHWQVRKIKLMGDNCLLMGNEKISPNLVLLSQIEIIGKICGRFTKENI